MSAVEFEIDAALEELKNEAQSERKSDSKGRMGNMNLVLLAGVLFVLLASPMAFNMTAPIAANVGLNLTSMDGTPNMMGVAAHGVVFVVAFYFLSKVF